MRSLSHRRRHERSSGGTTTTTLPVASADSKKNGKEEETDEVSPSETQKVTHHQPTFCKFPPLPPLQAAPSPSLSMYSGIPPCTPLPPAVYPTEPPARLCGRVRLRACRGGSSLFSLGWRVKFSLITLGFDPLLCLHSRPHLFREPASGLYLRLTRAQVLHARATKA